ncbi:MAG: hypothetical protein OEW05_12275 [Candidatus Aminicenantes bacterium]|nr:hypothetical protein [Candidatus Aminicenantes bacterium]
MNSDRLWQPLILGIAGLFWLAGAANAYEVFLWRPLTDADALSRTGRITMHGELFASLLAPSTFPSYNDLSGATDRWHFGFQDRIAITPTTLLLGQLLTHDDGTQRTKFDWHFSLRQELIENLVLTIGHDSDHDAEHLSWVRGKPFFTNRNYIGVGMPVEGETVYVEPFIRFFHHTNLRTFLDMSGEKIVQEFGLRLALRPAPGVDFHGQIFSQTDRLFEIGRDFIGEAIVRFRVTDWFELSWGFSLWRDIEISPAGRQQSFYKIMWGVAVPF